MADVKQLKEAVLWGCQLGNALGTSLVDGRIGVSDLLGFIGVLNGAQRAFDGIDQVAIELADLDAAEKQEVLDLVGKEFNIPQEKVELYVKTGLLAAAKLHDVYLLFKALQPKV
jgi:hypothetical protein